ncbi:MAG: DUF402 domain-containing protein [Dehalococcoidales bacterium]|nr:DUF402 domain-containing protein [Dehalococcoidales bacterium]
MSNTREKPFKPGQTVVIREIWQNRIWSARPVIVAQDTPELLALYSPCDTIFKQPVTIDGKRPTVQTRKDCNWIINDSKWPGEISGDGLRLTIPGKDYSIVIFFNRNSWYINFEDPLIRTDKGFDYMDMLLDAIVEFDLKSWYWKDEYETKAAIELNLLSNERVRRMYKEGKQLVKLLQSGKSIFNGWEHWKPDPSWKIPVLPDGWDII